MTTLAIDPGLGGGLAWKTEFAVSQPEPMPETEADVVALIRSIAPDVAVIEDIPWMTGLRVNPAALSKLHRNCGVIHGCLLTLGVKTILAPPKVWQARFGIAEKDYKKRKNRLKAEAQRRYPSLKISLATADAVLILDWAT